MSACTDQTTAHPRRRQVDAARSRQQGLRKGGTFHSPSPVPAEGDPTLSVRTLPRRSPTNLEAGATDEDRVTEVLARLDLGSSDVSDNGRDDIHRDGKSTSPNRCSATVEPQASGSPRDESSSTIQPSGLPHDSPDVSDNAAKQHTVDACGSTVGHARSSQPSSEEPTKHRRNQRSDSGLGSSASVSLTGSTSNKGESTAYSSVM